MVFNINLSGNETITTTNPYGSLELISPGSNQSGVTNVVVPYYNNIMGEFNQLKNPIIRAYYPCTGLSYNYDDGPINIRLKIVAKFKTLDLSKDIVYIGTYPIDFSEDPILATLGFTASFPSISCNDPQTLPASSAEVNAVCSGPSYRNTVLAHVGRTVEALINKTVVRFIII